MVPQINSQAGSRCAALAVLLLTAATALLPSVAGHGFMSEPAARNVLQHYLNCPHCLNNGGPYVSSKDGKLTWPDSKHPICGAEALNTPGAQLGGTYTAGQEFDIKVFVTAQHGGRHVFRLCPDAEVSEKCLESYTLQKADGTGPYAWTPLFGGPMGDGSKHAKSTYMGIPGEYYTWRFKLPEGLTCKHCVIQWWWTTANSCRIPGSPNNIGGSPTMSSCTDGEGPYPEEFWNCADVKVNPAPGGPAVLPQEAAPGKKPATVPVKTIKHPDAASPSPVPDKSVKRPAHDPAGKPSPAPKGKPSPAPKGKPSPQSSPAPKGKPAPKASPKPTPKPTPKRSLKSVGSQKRCGRGGSVGLSATPCT